MSGWINIACRLNDGSIYAGEAHSRNAHDLYSYSRTFLDGDDSGAKSYLDWHRSLGSDMSNEPLTENEYGVLAVDFIEKTILFNRNDWDITKSSHFDWNSPFDKEMAAAGRIELVCPEESTPSLKITPNLEAFWNHLVQYPNYPKYCDDAEWSTTPLPIRYYLRDPQPYFKYDFSPWTVLQFAEDNDQEFMDALEKHGFTVDRQNWLEGPEDFDESEYE